jgi:hypothetical protein
MNLCSSIDFCIDSSLSVITSDKCLLLLIVSRSHIHLGSSCILMSANHGLSAFNVFSMCLIGCGDRLSSHVWLPVSTPLIIMQGQGLPSFTNENL